MAYHIAEIKTHLDREDEVTSLLLHVGAEGTSAEAPQFLCDSIEAGFAEEWDEELLLEENHSDELIVKGYFPTDDQWPPCRLSIEQGIAELARSYGAQSFELIFWTLEDESWQDKWRSFFKPFRVGRRLVIKPVWEEYSAEADDIVLELEPGQAFGTGDHPTTGGALRFLEDHIAPGMRVMDLGCGSGILSVAALRLGAERVVAVDNDREAIRSTVKNARLNQVLERIDVQDKDLTTQGWDHLGSFDLLVANIVASVIIEIVPQAKTVLKPGGFFIAGGILRSKEDAVLDHLHDHGLRVIEIVEEGEWATFLAVKPTDEGSAQE